MTCVVRSFDPDTGWSKVTVMLVTIDRWAAPPLTATDCTAAGTAWLVSRKAAEPDTPATVAVTV